MRELSAEELRGAAAGANLRRAFAAPACDLPQAFDALLHRLGEATPRRSSLGHGRGDSPRPEA